MKLIFAQNLKTKSQIFS